MLDRALFLGKTLEELPFELNLWQAQNIWYEIMRTSSYGLTSLEAEDRERWEASFRELGGCLSIDCTTIQAQDYSLPVQAD